VRSPRASSLTSRTTIVRPRCGRPTRIRGAAGRRPRAVGDPGFGVGRIAPLRPSAVGRIAPWIRHQWGDSPHPFPAPSQSAVI